MAHSLPCSASSMVALLPALYYGIEAFNQSGFSIFFVSRKDWGLQNEFCRYNQSDFDLVSLGRFASTLIDWTWGSYLTAGELMKFSSCSLSVLNNSEGLKFCSARSKFSTSNSHFKQRISWHCPSLSPLGRPVHGTGFSSARHAAGRKAI